MREIRKTATDDTKGQKCNICLEAVHPRTGEGLVRGCACGDRDGVSSPELGVAHVSCLARQAEILVAEAEEDNLDDDKWHRWHKCSLCEQRYHGVVRCALGWACWRTYVGRPEADTCRASAMTQLGNGMHAAGKHQERLKVLEAELAIDKRLDAPEIVLLDTISNLAACYDDLGRHDAAHNMFAHVFERTRAVHGNEAEETFLAAFNYADSFISKKEFAAAVSLLREWIPRAVEVFGPDFEYTPDLRLAYARAIFEDTRTQNLIEALVILEDVVTRMQRIYGFYPYTREAQAFLECARMRGEDADAAGVGSSKAL